MLHLLREDSIARAVAASPDAEAIYERNIETLHRLGADGWHKLMSSAASSGLRNQRTFAGLAMDRTDRQSVRLAAEPATTEHRFP